MYLVLDLQPRDNRGNKRQCGRGRNVVQSANRDKVWTRAARRSWTKRVRLRNGWGSAGCGEAPSLVSVDHRPSALPWFLRYNHFARLLTPHSLPRPCTSMLRTCRRYGAHTMHATTRLTRLLGNIWKKPPVDRRPRRGTLQHLLRPPPMLLQRVERARYPRRCARRRSPYLLRQPQFR